MTDARKKDTRSISSDVAALKLDALDERSKGYNAALIDVAAILDRHEVVRQKLSVRALARRKSEGKKIGGDVPYGFELDDDGETLVERDDEQRAISTAKKLRGDGVSLRKIAIELRKLGMYPREFVLEISDNDVFHAAQIWRMTDAEKSR